jgi:hypothetical protein
MKQTFFEYSYRNLQEQIGSPNNGGFFFQGAQKKKIKTLPKKIMASPPLAICMSSKVLHFSQKKLFV